VLTLRSRRCVPSNEIKFNFIKFNYAASCERLVRRCAKLKASLLSCTFATRCCCAAAASQNALDAQLRLRAVCTLFVLSCAALLRTAAILLLLRGALRFVCLLVCLFAYLLICLFAYLLICL
jgi:hypothetical protein